MIKIQEFYDCFLPVLAERIDAFLKKEVAFISPLVHGINKDILIILLELKDKYPLLSINITHNLAIAEIVFINTTSDILINKIFLINPNCKIFTIYPEENYIIFPWSVLLAENRLNEIIGIIKNLVDSL
jgi:hypothetical protein